MFDPSLCQQVSSTRLWTTVSWTLLFVLSRPLLAIALLSCLVLIPLTLSKRIRQPKWKKRAVALGVALLMVYGLVAAPPLASLARYFLARNLPADNGESADAIVVLGRGYSQNEIRAQAAADLWQAKRAPIIFPSGRRDALVIADLLSEQFPSIEPEAIAGEPCSLTTEQNAQFTAAILWPQGVRKIILVSDLPHLRRSQLTFESFGFTIIPHVVPFNSESPTMKNFLVIRESLGLLTYGLQGRYKPKAIPSPSTITS